VAGTQNARSCRLDSLEAAIATAWCNSGRESNAAESARWHHPIETGGQCKPAWGYRWGSAYAGRHCVCECALCRSSHTASCLPARHIAADGNRPNVRAVMSLRQSRLFRLPIFLWVHMRQPLTFCYVLTHKGHPAEHTHAGKITKVVAFPKGGSTLSAGAT
jgi:hypothetical protein